MSEPLKDEDDFTHYFNATARLSQENAALRDTIRRVEEWRAMTALDADQDATLLAALTAAPEGA